MRTRSDRSSIYEVQFPGLPLAVYSEIAAHLCQVEGVVTGLYPQCGQFDYNQSQTDGLWIQYAHIAPENHARVEQILNYYQNHYGISWEGHLRG